MEKLILIAVALMGVALLPSHGLEYGQNCKAAGADNSTLECRSEDVSNPLTCNNVTFLCECPENLFRHQGLSRCVAKHNSDCTIRAGDGKPIVTCTEYAQCWPKASIKNDREDGTCYCDSDATYDEKSGLCKLKYGSSRCKKETDCDTLSLLTCREGKCSCLDEETQIHDGTKCVSLAGGSCKATPPFPAPTCEKTMDCDNDGVCQCKAGSTPTPEKTCGKVHNETCNDSDMPCHPQFTCDADSKKCACPSGQEYDAATKGCILLVGQSCDASNATLKCTTFATCVNSVCTCDGGYKANNVSKCVGLYQSACPDGTPCSEEDYLQCNADSKKCECIQNYEGEGNRCKGLIEQNCRETDDCIGSTVCSADGKCGCEDGLVPGDDKKQCLNTYGGSCDEARPCSESHYVSCIAGVCNCTNSEIMLPKPTEGYCVAKANTDCSSGINCVDNAVCQVNKCLCLSGFSANSKGECAQGGGGGGASSFSASVALITFVSFISFVKM